MMSGLQVSHAAGLMPGPQGVGEVEGDGPEPSAFTPIPPEWKQTFHWEDWWIFVFIKSKVLKKK